MCIVYVYLHRYVGRAGKIFDVCFIAWRGVAWRGVEDLGILYSRIGELEN